MPSWAVRASTVNEEKFVRCPPAISGTKPVGEIIPDWLSDGSIGNATNERRAHKSPEQALILKRKKERRRRRLSLLDRNTSTTNPIDLVAAGTFTMKFMKVGRVAIITRGRYAGKKVVIVQPNDTGSKAHPFAYAVVAGIERYPLKVTRRMGKKTVEKRSRIKPFIKVVNYNHLMPTRYTLELEGLKGSVTNDTFKEVSQREDAKKTVKKALEDRYTSGKNRWFFTPLRF
ncbi:60S ribosomal protein L27e [Aspergillus nomiae NRRL 13137]|nr:60S ribosomal protein L27e [Aspergillus nomiae NRRL 13137]KNG84662.1 60S ribosomal protein L27e [Aspergillus nomiae NRRL 13137]